MPRRTTDYHVGLLEDLQDPTEAALYLNAALEDSDEMLLVALRDVAEAHQVSRVAREVDISREHVYRMLSHKGNPRYSNLVSILRAFGLRLAVEVGPGNLAPAVPPSSPHTTSPDRVIEPAAVVGDLPTSAENTKSGLLILRGPLNTDIPKKPVTTEYSGWFQTTQAIA